MGKTRGHGSRRGAYKGSKGRGKEDEDSEEIEPQRGLGELISFQKRFDSN
jgi:hypothetical protein